MIKDIETNLQTNVFLWLDKDYEDRDLSSLNNYLLYGNLDNGYLIYQFPIELADVKINEHKLLESFEFGIFSIYSKIQVKTKGHFMCKYTPYEQYRLRSDFGDPTVTHIDLKDVDTVFDFPGLDFVEWDFLDISSVYQDYVRYLNCQSDGIEYEPADLFLYNSMGARLNNTVSCVSDFSQSREMKNLYRSKKYTYLLPSVKLTSCFGSSKVYLPLALEAGNYVPHLTQLTEDEAYIAAKMDTFSYCGSNNINVTSERQAWDLEDDEDTVPDSFYSFYSHSSTGSLVTPEGKSMYNYSIDVELLYRRLIQELEK